MTHGENRRFWSILGCSALLHGALFATLSVQHKPVVLPAIVASIRLVDVASGDSAAALPEAAVTSPKARPDAPRAEARAAPRPIRPARPVREAVAAPVAASAPAAVATPQPAPLPASSGAPAAEAPPPVANALAVPTQSDVLAGYRQRLTELFARGYEYPRIAALRGWEGEVRLRLKVARKGNLLGVHLDRSSGFAVLDQHALALLEGHGSLPPLPEALEGSEIQVIVPINYKLRKTT